MFQWHATTRKRRPEGETAREHPREMETGRERDGESGEKEWRVK